ncbi:MULTISPECIES: FCD domain-containing protein [Tenebrionibacter/Tenebrionicola group]|jgi:GntR family colanic acid and biofilm gene transcriptional regulator|uniref:FCD domain-containing protein n=2 Tax=Tenebrionibacter/Tenebrionicola group TaxID=2969848 RepID=A0A8K0V173_9ENTR|nr:MULTISPECIES: FCD domain-containing protein [Tenebrionibacter/Tenebrionicola group]MBK4715554.1 FCD domain-containing protein [Tenebrionibacter intestinalis]MBV4411356.1 FCD domain-containing protein [Tenebrionicola larvae]MBV5095797.1 FCD domain-containing protein [Tenebrionicola larvae]
MLSLEKTQRASLTTLVELRLKGALIVGALKPGARLVTKDIAARLGTSITPVREALLRLASSGALEATPAQAFQVPCLPLARFQEITAIRKNLEGMAVREACRCITVEQTDSLRQLLEVYRQARHCGVVESGLQANRALRFRLYGFARLPVLTEMIEQLWVCIGPGYHFLYPASQEMVGSYEDYVMLIEALAAHDETQAERLIHRVIDIGAQIILRRYD